MLEIAPSTHSKLKACPGTVWETNNLCITKTMPRTVLAGCQYGRSQDNACVFINIYVALMQEGFSGIYV